MAQIGQHDRGPRSRAQQPGRGRRARRGTPREKPNPVCSWPCAAGSAPGHHRPKRNALDALLDEVTKRARGPGDLDALTRSDREADVEATLEDARPSEPLGCGAGARRRGLRLRADPRRFSRLRCHATSRTRSSSSHALTTSNALLGEIHESTRRMAALVNALKRHVQLDQAPVQLVDVEPGPRRHARDPAIEARERARRP